MFNNLTALMSFNKSNTSAADDDSSGGASYSDHSDDEEEKKQQDKPPSRRKTIVSMMGLKGVLGRPDALNAAFAESSSPPVVDRKATPPKPKTQQELDAEREKKLWEMEQAEQEKTRKEKQRLESEPAIAKALRKAFIDANNVLVLLNEVFNGRRFGNISKEGNASYLGWLRAETESNEATFGSMKLFIEWKMSIDSVDIPSKINENFDFCPWTKKITRLSELWNEVFRHYAIAEGEAYLFSLQPLEKLRYFFEELNAMTTLERQFCVYMRDASVEVSVAFLETKKSDLEQFIIAMNLFSARTMTLYKLLDGLKTQMERTEEMQRQLRGISKMKIPDNIVFTVIDNDEDEDEALVQPDWLLRLDAAIAAINVKTLALSGYESQLEYYAKDTVEYCEADVALKLVKKELEPIKAELEDARKEAQIAGDDLARAKAEAKKIKAEKKATQAIESAEESERRRDADQQRKAFTTQASIAATQFLLEYAARSESAEALTLSQPIQAPLSTVSTEMLQLWLSDQKERLSFEDSEWLSALIAPEVRELTFCLSVTPNESMNVEILLEDKNGEMLEVLSISFDGSARGSLIHSSKQSVSEKISQTYLAQLQEAGNSLIPGFKLGSDTSVRAANLLLKIRNTRVEFQAHDTLPHMNRKTFALFGLYLLLYLQDAPEHNFTSKFSTKIPGGGGRFVFELMRRVQEELGHHLRHCKVIYDAMNQRTAAVEKTTTTRSSLVGTKASAAHEDEGLSGKFSSDLEYIFDLNRTVSELEKPALAARKIVSIKGNEVAQDILVRELTGRYLSHSDEKYTSLQSLMMEENLPEVDRKRMKRIVELMEQLPLTYEKRRQLMDSPIVQLFILREQGETYKRSSTGQKRSSVTSAIVGIGRGFLKVTGADRKEDKFKFFEAVFAYLKLKFIATANGNAAPVEDVFVTQPFIIKFYADIMHTEEYADVGMWVIKNILDGVGMEALDALMWLPNDVLDHIFVGAGIGARTVREMKGTSEAAFSYIHDSGNNSVDEEVFSNTSIVSANELMIVLAFQAAVLSFDELILTQKNEKLIVIASQHSWFLQLRFWKVIMVEKGVLSEFVQGHTAVQNRVLERNMLKIIDNMMSNISELAMTTDKHNPDGVMRYFSQTNAKDLDDDIKQMPSLLKVKLACVLITGFLALYFRVLASEKSAPSADKAVWKRQTNYFNHILAMAGVTFNKEDEAMLFAIMVNFIFANPVLLVNLRIEGCLLKDVPHLRMQADQTQHVISNKDGSLFDVCFFTASAKTTLVKDSAEVEKARLSTTKAAHFVRSVTLNDPAERIALQHALNSKK